MMALVSRADRSARGAEEPRAASSFAAARRASRDALGSPPRCCRRDSAASGRCQLGSCTIRHPASGRPRSWTRRSGNCTMLSPVLPLLCATLLFQPLGVLSAPPFLLRSPPPLVWGHLLARAVRHKPCVWRTDDIAEPWILRRSRRARTGPAFAKAIPPVRHCLSLGRAWLKGEQGQADENGSS